MHVRIARPTRNLVETARLYTSGLGFEILGSFEDHQDFDGIMVGEKGGAFHFEFTHSRSHPVDPRPTLEDLVVLYVPDDEEWESRCAKMAAAGFHRVPSFNPYWELNGQTFEDLDGYRLVIQNAAWG